MPPDSSDQGGFFIHIVTQILPDTEEMIPLSIEKDLIVKSDCVKLDENKIPSLSIWLSVKIEVSTYNDMALKRFNIWLGISGYSEIKA